MAATLVRLVTSKELSGKIVSNNLPFIYCPHDQPNWSKICEKRKRNLSPNYN